MGRRLTAQEVKKLHAAVATDTLKGKRDLAILDTTLFAGLRRSEVGGLQVGNPQHDGGRYWLVVTGKGHR